MKRHLYLSEKHENSYFESDFNTALHWLTESMASLNRTPPSLVLWNCISILKFHDILWSSIKFFNIFKDRFKTDFLGLEHLEINVSSSRLLQLRNIVGKLNWKVERKQFYGENHMKNLEDFNPVFLLNSTAIFLENGIFI